MTYTSVTQKYQATIPLNIRKHLNLHQGDRLGFEIVDGEVIIKKVTPLDIEFSKALESTLSEEWDSKEDEEAYRDL
ncbi:MAG: AbrB/MazE/SpoVT family DNA-binding domain-containing protein [Alphaproteobacteria bacterium]|nr:AbrB/MazE/SpoVT family DNA-binding domain-containing protein [Alphaproteobacteria bacterium]